MKLSEETKLKISQKIKDLYKIGKLSGFRAVDKTRLREYGLTHKSNLTHGYRKGSGVGISGWYKGIWCDSSWELAYVIYCLEHGIPIERNKRKFKYLFADKYSYFIPDFVVNGKLTEIKGRMDERNRAKIEQMIEPIDIIGKLEIIPYLQYVIDKYGRNFIHMYDERKRGGVTLKCGYCLKSFERTYHDKRYANSFCSKECRDNSYRK